MSGLSGNKSGLYFDVQIDSEDKIAELLAGAYPEASYFAFLEARTDNVGERTNGIPFATE